MTFQEFIVAATAEVLTKCEAEGIEPRALSITNDYLGGVYIVSLTIESKESPSGTKRMTRRFSITEINRQYGGGTIAINYGIMRLIDALTKEDGK